MTLRWNAGMKKKQFLNLNQKKTTMTMITLNNHLKNIIILALFL